MMTHCGMTVKMMGMLGVCVCNMKALTVKMGTPTLIGTHRQNVTCFCIRCIKLMVKCVF